MNKQFKVLIFLLLTVCFCMNGCTSSKKVPIQGAIGKGIQYQGKIYWETSSIEVSQCGKEIGQVKKAAEKGIFPEKNFCVTDSAKDYIGAHVFIEDNMLYIDVENERHVFEYMKEMDLGKEVPLNLEADADGMASPHFVYENMRYLLNPELAVDQIPESFTKAGEVEKNYTAAIRNNTGNLPIGTEFYASGNQNRYIIVKHKDNTFGVYENEGYLLNVK